MLCFARNSFVVTALWTGALSWCRIQLPGAPLLRTMSAHSVAEALQECFVEFLIYRLSCMDELMMNQSVNVEERNQQFLDTGLHLPHFLRSKR